MTVWRKEFSIYKIAKKYCDNINSKAGCLFSVTNIVKGSEILFERMSLTARSELWICQLCLTHAPFLRVDLCIYFECYKSKRSLHVTFRIKTIHLYRNKRGLIFFMQQTLSAAEAAYNNWNLQRFFRSIYDYLDWGKRNENSQNIVIKKSIIVYKWRAEKQLSRLCNFSLP